MELTVQARYMTLFMALALAGGCAYESSRPIFPADQAIDDPSIGGGWKCTAADEPEMSAVIVETRPREYEIELSASGKTVARLRGFVTRSGGSTILNIQQIGESNMIGRNRYAAVRYVRAANGSLDVSVLRSRTNGRDIYNDLLHCMPQNTIGSLESLPPFEVTIVGTPLISPLSGRPAFYYESWFGERRGDEWISRQSGGRSQQDLRISTPRGPLDVRLANIRTYLAAASVSNGAMDGEEYRLEPNRTYYARVASETYLLPPRGGAPPESRERLVLQITDAPFVNLRPQRPLTPAFQDFR